jgi:hypothetical protein
MLRTPASSVLASLEALRCRNGFSAAARRFKLERSTRSTPNLLFLFFQRLAVDAEGGDWAGFQSRIGNLFFASLTDAIDVLVHSLKRLVDLLDQPLLALTDTHRKILLGLRRRLIADIRERFLTVWIGKTLDHLVYHGFALPLKVTTNSRILFPLGRFLGSPLGRDWVRR